MTSTLPTRPSDDEPERFYIGKDKPQIQVSRHPKHWEGKLYAPWELKDEADNLPESPEQNWEEGS